MADKNNNNKESTSTSMGDAFKQRRSAGTSSKQHEGEGNNIPSTSNSSSKKTLLEIQDEQEKEQKQQQQQRGNNSGGGGGFRGGSEGYARGRGGSSSGRGGGDRDGRNNQSDNNTRNFDRNNNIRGGRFGSNQNSYNNNSNNNNDEVGGDEGEENDDRNRRGGGGRGSGRGQQQRRGGRDGGNGTGRGNNSNNNDRLSNLPLEQGVICTLRDGFGFIHCADRAEQIFFHFSELRDALKSTDLKIDDEIQFRVGEPPASKGNNNNGGGDDGNTKRIAAKHITRIPNGTKIIWEYPDETYQYPIQGLVERSARLSDNNRGGGGTSSSTSSMEGTIRILLVGDENNESKDGPLIRYLPDEYKPSNKDNDNSSNSNDTESYIRSMHPSSGRHPTSLSRGDLVEITQIIIDRRSKEKYAKQIKMIMSERQKSFQSKEAKLLETATIEHGIVTSLKGDFGFLKSNQRHEEVYFHVSSISSIHVDDDDDNKVEKKTKKSLKEGQEMKFLVVTEGDDGNDESGGGGGKNRRRVSARQVQLQPVGSVQFHDVLAQGVTGEVIDCPQPIDSGHPLETQGKVRLHTPIRLKKKCSLEEAMEREERIKQGITTDKDEDDEYVMCTDVLIWSHDSPGGNYEYRGGSSIGLYIQNGDILLFDVIRDYIGDGGTCRAAPTKYLTPRKEEQDITHLESNTDINYTDPSKKIRLIDLSLAGRAEGVINALKDSTYGFLHFAERPIDVHFKMYQLLPDELQADLRRNMGLPERVKLDVGVEVQFDLSVHGTISPTSRQYGGGNKKRQPKQTVQERENVKAQRILLLPAGTIRLNHTVEKSVQGKICKQDLLQPYVGTVELDTPVKPISPEERHPLVAKLLQKFMTNTFTNKIIYHDLQSLKEDEVVVKMVETIGKGRLKCSHIPVAGEDVYPGLLCIEKVTEVVTEIDSANNVQEAQQTSSIDIESKEETDSEDGGSQDGISKEENDAKQKRRKKRAGTIQLKAIKTIRYDKNCLAPAVRNDMPPGVDDLISCDIVQNRRSGQVMLENIIATTRYVQEITSTSIEATGVIKDIMPNHDFGFISVLDDSDRLTETITFQLSTLSQSKNVQIRKGDSVKFTIGNDVKNGRRSALNVTPVDSKQKYSSMTNNKTTDMNPCKGIILLKLTKNSFIKVNDSTPVKKRDEVVSKTPAQGQESSLPEKKSRWENVKTSKHEENRQEVVELGCILLTQDTHGLFVSKSTNIVSSTVSTVKDIEINNSEAKTGSSENEQVSEMQKLSIEYAKDDCATDVVNNMETLSLLKSHLHFKKSNVATSGGADESSFPQRGDLVSFNKTRNGSGVRDIRVIQRNAAALVQGTLRNIDIEAGIAKFVVGNDSEDETVYDIDLKEIVSCDLSTLKEDDSVEGIRHDNQIFGICRLIDIYVEPKKSNINTAKASSERQKLNLTVKKDRGGTIMAQSMMAKGPEPNSKGFLPGWTTRLSPFVPEFTIRMDHTATSTDS